MIVIVIGLLRTNLSSLYRGRRGLGFTWSLLQGRKHNIRIAKLTFHAKESPIQPSIRKDIAASKEKAAARNADRAKEKFKERGLSR